MAIGVLVKKLSSELSQPVIVPVFPARVNVPEFVPEHTEASALTVPPTEAGSTVIVAAAEIAAEQLPDFTIALNFVVALRSV